jgi:hypothetical protein
MTDQFRSSSEEVFDLGGLYGFGGPLYGHSCTDRNAFPSLFRLRRVYAALTADSLVFFSGKVTAIDTTNPTASTTRPLIERQALDLREVTGAWLNVVDETRGPAVVTTIASTTKGTTVARPPLEEPPPRAFIVLRCTTTSALCDVTLPVALEDSSTGRAFAAHLLASARRLQGQK